MFSLTNIFKIIFISLLMIFSFLNVFADEYNWKSTWDWTKKQSTVQNLSPAWYERIRQKYPKDQHWNAMTDTRIKELLSDWKNGQITEYAERLLKDNPEQYANQDQDQDQNSNWDENRACIYNWDTSVIGAMKWCLSWVGTNWKKIALVWVDWWDLKVAGGFKDQIISWTKKIGWFLGIWAIFAIAFGSLKMTMSWWEEEAIKKGKDIVKWWVLGFLLVVSAGFIVAFVVNIIYWVLW